jgi:hypothetical protein
MSYLKNYLIDINFIFEYKVFNKNNQNLINFLKKNYLKKKSIFSKQIIGCGYNHSFIFDEKSFN